MCDRCYRKRLRERNPQYADRERQRSRAWYARNREAAIARQRKSDAQRAAERAAYQRRYQQENRERLRAYRAAYRVSDQPGAMRLREQQAVYSASYRDRYPDEVRRRTADHESRRRAQRRATEVESIDRMVVYRRDGGLCGLCGGWIHPSDLEVDHVVPLSRSGTHTYTNVQAAHAVCNRRKGASVPPS